MKNFFKKSDKKAVAKTQTLDKKQLEKVIGGAETILTTSTTETVAHELAHVVQQGK